MTATPRLRWVWVNPETLAEKNFKTKPDHLPTLSVEIIDDFTEQCLTYNTLQGSAVMPPGVGWQMVGGFELSTRWIRTRKRK